MNYKSIVKNQTKVILFSVLALVVVTIGVSYSLFLRVDTSTKNQVVEAGSLVVEFKGGVSITGGTCLTPTTDPSTGCTDTVTVTNNGTLPALYSLYMYDDLEKIGSNQKLDWSKIKVTVNNGEVKHLSEYTNYTGEIGDTANKNQTAKLLAQETIEVGSTKEYEIRVWIDEEEVETDIIGQYVYLKLGAYGEVFETPTSLVGDPSITMPALASTDETVCGDNGVVQVSHNDVTGTTNDSEFQKTEYRYCGEDPNNYVTFNGEEAGWRIIGLVNTPEGQRIKLIKADSIGNHSWDYTSSGTYTNDWSTSTLQSMLNSGAYYNRTTGEYYNNSTTATNVDFSSNGLTEEAKKMIDTITWNLGGTANYTSASNGLASHWYNYERGTTVYSGRPKTWNGEIGLMYPSDYGYATGGGSTTNRSSCLAKELYNWDGVSECYKNDWLYNNTIQWTLSPGSSNSYIVFYVYSTGYVGYGYADYAYAVRPVLYLRSNVQITGGNGDKNSPYELYFPDSGFGEGLIEGSGEGSVENFE